MKQWLSTVPSDKKSGFNIKEYKVVKANALVERDRLLSYSSVKAKKAQAM